MHTPRGSPVVVHDSMSAAAHAICIDASALAKRFLDEPCSEELRRYLHSQPTPYTTPFCLYETLSVLKSKVGKTFPDRKTFSRENYFRAAGIVVNEYRVYSARMKEPDFTAMDVFARTTKLAEQYGVDLSDAFQLLSLQEGFFSVLSGESATLLVTADKALAKAARDMGWQRVWDCCHEDMPTF